MITAHATIASAVEAMRFGAFDYLEKPFRRGADSSELVARAMERRRSWEPQRWRVPRSDQAESRLAGDDLGMVGESPAMRRAAAADSAGGADG